MLIKINKIAKFTKSFVEAILYYAYTSSFKKDKNLWLYGAWKGTSYNDNPKYFFEYVSDNHKNIKSVWITKSKDVYNQVKSKGYEVELYNSPQAKRYIKRAGFLIESEGSRDIGYYPVGGAKVIQLGHGIFAKKCMWFKRNNNLIKQSIINVISDNHAKSFWLRPSEYYENLMSEIYGVPSENYINAGLPRNDAIVHGCEDIFFKSLRNNFQKIIIYLPTHRNWGRDFDINFIIDGFKKLDQYGKNKGYAFIYKAHPNEIELVKSVSISLDNVIILDGKKFEDVHSYLYEFDALISDYSGIIYDFLPTNRPIILFDYDLDNYDRYDGGISDDYFKFQVGPIAYDWGQLISYIDESFTNDKWINNRTEAIEYFNPMADGNNCERLYNEIITRLS